MNPLVLMSLTYKMRATTEDPGGPILLTAEPEGWRIKDGRHRAIAALIAGRPDVLAMEHHSCGTTCPSNPSSV
jgi:hypothetical protein